MEDPEYKQCEQCGRFYAPQRKGGSRQRFCSVSCRVAAHRSKPVGCRYCAHPTDSPNSLQLTNDLQVTYRFCCPHCLWSWLIGFEIADAMADGYPKLAAALEAMEISNSLWDGMRPIDPLAAVRRYADALKTGYIPGGGDGDERDLPRLDDLPKLRRRPGWYQEQLSGD